MGVANRDLDPSEQKRDVSVRYDLISTSGGTFPLMVVPQQAEITAVSVTAEGISGTPSIEIEAYKFSGGVTINSDVMVAMAYNAFATSGVLSSASLGVAGSTQVQVDAGSVLVATATGTNAAADNVTIHLVLKSLQDIRSHHGE